MNKKIRQPCIDPSQQVGLTLIEVLLALVLVSFGMLGFAKAYSTSLLSLHDTDLQNRAMILVLDMAERIHANTSKSCNSNQCRMSAKLGIEEQLWKKQVAFMLPGADATLIQQNENYKIEIRWRTRMPHFSSASCSQGFTTTDNTACLAFMVTL